MAPLPRSLFTAKKFPEEDRFQSWREDIGGMFDLKRGPVSDERPFHATFETYKLDSLVFGKLTSSNARYRRSEKMISGDGLDMVLAQLLLRGTIQFGTGSNTTYAEAGDILIFDLGQRLDNVNIDFEHITVVIPRSVIEEVVPRATEWHGRVLPRAEPSVNLFRRHLLSLFELAPRLSVDAAPQIAGATVSLLAGAFGSTRENRRIGETDDPLSGSVVFQIKKLIRENLASPRLSPEFIAAKLGISRAQLYRLMEPHGGVAASIRDQRLEKCRIDLINPGTPGETVSEIAYRWGFKSPDSFSRIFKQCYGQTPRDYRHRANLSAVASEIPTDRTAETDFQKWIRRMSLGG